MGFVCLFVLEVLTLLSKIQHFLPQFFCLIVLFNVKIYPTCSLKVNGTTLMLSLNLKQVLLQVLQVLT